MSVGTVNHGVSPQLPRNNTPRHPGHTEPAVVTGHGSRLEQKAVAQTADPALAQALATLAARYRVELSGAAQREIVAVAVAGDSALATLRAGLYLNKVGADITPVALMALAAAQQVPPLPSNSSAATDRGAIVITNPSSGTGTGPATLGQLLERVMAQDSVGADVSSGSGDHNSGNSQQEQGKHGQRQPESLNAAESRRALSHQLLSLSDGGALAYRYATLPLLVAGKLVELDMALFQQKPSASTAGSPQRLVMSLNTSRLGTVRIVAQSLRSNLSIALASTSQRGVAVLTASQGPIRARLTALGWQVDSVRCELATEVSSAGREIIDHVLTTGSLDRAL